MKKSPVIIGITGGIGGGKTTFSSILKQKGYLVYDTDAEAKKLQNEHPTIKKQISDYFGDDVYNDSGLDRKKLATLVFNNKAALTKLNKIVHPIVKIDFLDWCKKHQKERLLFVESAILYESRFDELVDFVLLVTADENERIKRVMKRDNISKEQVLSRMANQYSEKEKESKSDFIIHTDDGVDLHEKTDKLLTKLLFF